MSRQLSMFDYLSQQTKRRRVDNSDNNTQEIVAEPDAGSSTTCTSISSSSNSTIISESQSQTQSSFSSASSTRTSTTSSNVLSISPSVTVSDLASTQSCSLSQPVNINLTSLERIFGSASVGVSRPERAFSELGFRDWKHVTGTKGILVCHNNGHSHKQAIVAWQQFKSSSENGTVSDLLGTSRAEQIKRNKHYIRSIAEVLLLCCKQELALRGHDESIASLNKGNFLEILTLLANHDKTIEERLSFGPRNAKYTSHTIQNELIGIMASLVRNTIAGDIHKSGYYSILADETKDLSKQEQLSIVVRYLDSDTSSIKERFLTFLPAMSLNSESLSNYILGKLDKYNLDPKLMVSQGYDGASVMSGRSTVVQQRVREVAPYPMYVHCHAHVLNLVLVDCVRNNSHASEFFTLLQTLYVLMSTSKAHVIFIDKQKELHPGKQTRELKRLSDTRWACRSLTLDVIASTYDSIIATLECLAEDTDKNKAVEAIGLLHQIASFQFLASLIIFQRVMSITKSLSDQLQSQTVDLSFAASLVLSNTSTLNDLRDDTTWDHTYKYICDVAALNNIDVCMTSTRRRHRPPRRLQDSITFESTGSREPQSCSQSMKVTIYFPVLDHILFELNRRFSSSNLDVMKSLDACNPTSSSFLDSSFLSSLASLYDISDDLLYNECLLAKKTLQQHNSTVLEVYQQLVPLQSAFPTLAKLFQVALTMVVSTAQSFSALKRIKTYLRTTMSDQRLADVSVLSVERDLTTNDTFLDKTIQEFEGIDKNRTIVLS